MQRLGRIFPRRLTAVVLLVSVAIVAACGDDDTADTTATSDRGSTTEDGGGHRVASRVADGARHVPVGARSFEFEPADITVRAGEDIAIVLSSEDSLHDFTIDELDAHVAAEPGATSIGGLRAEGPGRFTFYCSVAGHREAGMEGTLVVEG